MGRTIHRRDIHWGLRQTVAPFLDPVTLTQAKLHVRQDLPVDDDVLSDQLATATRKVEQDCGRQLAPATYTLTLDHFPGQYPGMWAAFAADYPAQGCGGRDYDSGEHASLRLPKPPLLGVSGVVYVDTTGAVQTLSPTLYQVDVQSEPGRIQPAYGLYLYWPFTRPQLDAVTVTYTAGHAHTTLAEAIAPGVATVTPANTAGIAAGESAEIDAGAASEVVLVASATLTTITATFAKAHNAGCVLSKVPRQAKQAILLLVGHWFQNREPVVAGGMASVPQAYDTLVQSLWTGEYR